MRHTVLSLLLAASCKGPDTDLPVETDRDSDSPTDTDRIDTDRPADTDLPVDTDLPADTDLPVDTDTSRTPDEIWADVLATPGVDWVYRPRDATADLAMTVPITSGAAPLALVASGASLPNISNLEWVADGGTMDYTTRNLWYANLGPRPVYIDRGDGDEYLRFINGSASNYETQPSQLSPPEARGERMHVLYAFRAMPGSGYEAIVNIGITIKDRSGDGHQIVMYYRSDTALSSASGTVVPIGQDSLFEIAIEANGDVELILNGDSVITGNFPSLPTNGLVELTLGTNSHIASHQFRGIIINRGGFFDPADLDTLRSDTNELWPRGEFPSYPYLDGAFEFPYTTFDPATTIWSPSTGTFSGGNGIEGTHEYQWYYWKQSDDATFPLGFVLDEHLPFPGADGQGPTLRRSDYSAGNTHGNPVIFDDPGNADVRIMRVIVPHDSAGTAGEPLAGDWKIDDY